MNQAKVLINAQRRFNTYLDILVKSELTIVHSAPGEDQSTVDVTATADTKRSLAKTIATACIDAEISGHSRLWIILHYRKISRLSEERKTIQQI